MKLPNHQQPLDSYDIENRPLLYGESECQTSCNARTFMVARLRSSSTHHLRRVWRIDPSSSVCVRLKKEKALSFMALNRVSDVSAAEWPLVFLRGGNPYEAL